MAHKAPGKAYREGITLVELTRMFPSDEAAETWFRGRWWPDGPHCPHCGTTNVQCDVKHPTMTHRCRECRSRPLFSMKTGTLMEGSKLGYQTWAFAVYLVTTNLKGVSSMKLHRDLGVSQKTAWHLAHRIREAWKANNPAFVGPVETDTTYIGGKLGNMHAKKRKAARQKPDLGKSVATGVKDRASGAVSAQTVEYADKPTLQGFVRAHTAEGAKVYTDEARAYLGLPNHEAVNHGAGKYVEGDVHVQGLEAFWSMLKRGYHGTYHHWSPKHGDRYLAEFAGRNNVREADTIDQMEKLVANMVGRRLTYQMLVGGGE